MKVWEVGISDCESSSTLCICLTKEIALREMFKKRDSLVAEWEEADKRNEEERHKWCSEQATEYSEDDMYKRMIIGLAGDDWEKWSNYPHECPWIRETEVIIN